MYQVSNICKQVFGCPPSLETVQQTRYLPFGGYRAGSSPNPITSHAYTSQRENMDIGLYYYNARYYAPTLARFLSPDTIVPDPANPQAFNRYSYVENRPLNFNDPTGQLPHGITLFPYHDSLGTLVLDVFSTTSV
ncbi:MAG: RHS repeat-associated core domain-containing protein [Chloroflexi bacterium]|nr:MAG: RHS repeat-associated core domain-containing protein [Chloroflexota bacterium]